MRWSQQPQQPLDESTDVDLGAGGRGARQRGAADRPVDATWRRLTLSGCGRWTQFHAPKQGYLSGGGSPARLRLRRLRAHRRGRLCVSTPPSLSIRVVTSSILVVASRPRPAVAGTARRERQRYAGVRVHATTGTCTPGRFRRRMAYVSGHDPLLGLSESRWSIEDHAPRPSHRLSLQCRGHARLARASVRVLRPAPQRLAGYDPGEPGGHRRNSQHQQAWTDDGFPAVEHSPAMQLPGDGIEPTIRAKAERIDPGQLRAGHEFAVPFDGRSAGRASGVDAPVTVTRQSTGFSAIIRFV